MSRRNVALLLPALVLATGLASAQSGPGIKISQVDPTTGQVTHSTFDPSSGPVAKAPTPGPLGTLKYWDGLPSTNYYVQPNYTTNPPNPQIAVGPDDVLTVVNRTIARYPNPNASGNTGAPTSGPNGPGPYDGNYPPTHASLIDAWLGIQGGQGVFAPLCPSHADNVTCLLDNISIRYDQLQGRFVFLATVTDLESHMSNWVLLISKWANFACSTTPPPNNPAVCQGTSDLFTQPIVPNNGGPAVGGFNSNWVGYAIPINVILGPSGAATGAVTLPAGTTIGIPFCPNGGNPGTAPPNGGNGLFNFGPGNAAGTLTSGCTNYYPTGARFGVDNDNIILTSPVLDQTQTVFASSGGAGLPGGAFAGTRVTTVPKLVVYNGNPLTPSQGPFGFPITPSGGTPVTSLGAINLFDDINTGTLTGCPNTFLALCGANPIPGLTPQLGPTGGMPGFFGYNTLNFVGIAAPTSNIPPVFWEPDNLRGRALASFDAQVNVNAPTTGENASVEGVLTPLDYLVGMLIPGTPGGMHANSSRMNFWVQPIVFSCPASFIFGTNSGVTFCGTAGGLGTQVADLPALGVLNTLDPNTRNQQEPRTNANPLTLWGDPQLVGQGLATSQVNTGTEPAPTGLPPLVGSAPSAGQAGQGPAQAGQGGNGMLRLFVGDGRPQQVIFREGLLYVARAAMETDTAFNTLGTSTVVYDIIKQAGPSCQNGAGAIAGLGGNGPFCSVPSAQCPNSTTPGCSASPFSINGVTIPNPVTILETQWYNGTTPSVCPPVAISGPVSGAGNTSNNTFEPLCDSSGLGFYAPMYDTPANVVGGLSTSANQPISPISLFPWLEKLFVGMTTGGTPNVAATFNTNNPSLWDFRPGDDAYDSSLFGYIDPINGRHKTTTNDPFLCNITHNVADNGLPGGNSSLTAPTAQCPVVPFGTRGGASTDPNDGSLWLYGAFAKKRFSQSNAGPGAWGTTVANYALDFPLSDPYNNDNSYFVDVQPGGGNPFFTWIQISKNVGIGFQKLTTGTCPTGGTQGNPNPPNPPIIPPSTGNSSGGTTQGAAQTCNLFGPTDLVSRSEMAKWIVLAQMDEAQVTQYLLATGGLPGCTDLAGNTTIFPGQTLACKNNTQTGSSFHASSFGDGPCSGFTGAAACPAGSVPIPTLASTIGSSYSYPGIFDDPNLRYIETMKRRGYTKGCAATPDAILLYCPTAPVTRGQMAVFVIRAKMNNVFPTSLSGVPLVNSSGSYGDNFTTFLGQNPQAVPGAFAPGVYFADEPNTDPYFIYIQKMRELRITNGTLPNADPNHPCSGPCYSPFLSITRQEVATFVVRAFFL